MRRSFRALWLCSEFVSALQFIRLSCTPWDAATHPPRRIVVVPNGVMSSGCRSDLPGGIVIRKRRRRTAVDPCLGYYERNETDVSDPVLQEETLKDYMQKGHPQEKSDGSDSVEAITSPLPDSGDVVTVEDFLRHQATSSDRKSRVTYSRKRRRRIQFSSDDEVENHPAVEEVPNCSSSPTPSSRADGESRSKSIQTKYRKLPHRLRKPRKMTRMAFSKRIQRAALMTGGTTDADAPAPLQLVSHDQLTPPTPTRDKRAKLVDPRIPRRLDISFANKENLGTPCPVVKTCRPFLQWGHSFPRLVLSSPTVIPKAVMVKNVTQNTPSSTITPLILVSYEEHDQARAAKFGHKTSRLCHPGSKVIVCGRGDKTPALPMFAVREDLFDPHSRTRPQDGALANRGNECRGTESRPALPPPDIPGIPGPRTSHSPLAVAPDSPGKLTSSISGRNETQNIRAACTPDSSDVPPPRTGFSRHLPPSLALTQKPMRRIGTMLDGFRERARSILLSRSRTHEQANSPLTEAPSSKIRRTGTGRSTSQRLVLSSPARHPTFDSTSENVCSIANKDIEMVVHVNGRKSEAGKKVRRAISMPSVSATLGYMGQEGALEEPIRLKRQRPVRYRPPTARCAGALGTFLAGLDLSEDKDNAVSSLTNANSASAFLFNHNSGCPVPNLFDLLEEADLGSGASGASGTHVILSPSV